MKVQILTFLFINFAFLNLGQARDYSYTLPLSTEGQPAQLLVVQEKNLSSNNRFIFHFTPARDGFFQVKDQGYHFGGKPHAAIYDVTDPNKKTTVAEDVSWVMHRPVAVLNGRKYALVISQKENKEATGFILLWGAFGENLTSASRLNVHLLCEATGDGKTRQVWVSSFEIAETAGAKFNEYFAVDLFFMGKSDSIHLCGTKYTNFGSGSCWRDYPRSGGEVRTCDFRQLRMTTVFSNVRADSGYMECTLNGKVTKRLEYYNCKPFVRSFHFYGNPLL